MIEVDLELMRVLVVVDTFKELCFETSVDFTGGEFYEGEEVPILLRYEKLFGYCEACGSLCHQEAKCPLMKGFKQHPERKMEISEGSGGWHEGNKHDDRARSFKGVVINGNGAQQNRERDTKDYYGKGKGKMFEETYSKWVRVADRSNRKPSGYKGNARGNGEETRNRTVQRDEENFLDQEGKKKETPRQQIWSQEEAQEEGEIRTERDDNQLPPSQGVQRQLTETQAMGAEVVSDPKDTENGLKQLQGLVEGQLKIREDEVMDWDDLEAADELPDLTEEEMAAMNLELEENAVLDDVDEQPVNEEAKGQQAEMEATAETKQATKKRLFKSTLSTAASTKMRSAKGLASPRKRAPVKAGTRTGDNRHQQESKAASLLLAVHQKP